MKTILAATYLLFGLMPKMVAFDPCLKEVDAIFKAMYAQLPQKDKVVFVSYEVVTTRRAQAPKGREESQRSMVKTYASQQQYRFISEDIEVYQDQEESFTVIPSRKVVYRAYAGIRGNGDERRRKMLQLQDSLFRNCDHVVCTKMSEAGTADKLVSLFPSKAWTDLTQITSVDYYLNSSKKELIRQVIHYTAFKKLKHVEYIFHEIDYDHKQVTLSRPVKSLFMDGNKLRDTYKGYQLLDVRHEKNKKK